jgi:hypothetical protein
MVMIGLHSAEARTPTDGRDLIPACRIAMTNGEAAAFLTDRFKSGSFEGTNRPIIVVPPM